MIAETNNLPINNDDRFAEIIQQFKKLDKKEAFEKFNELIPDVSDEELLSLINIYSCMEFIKYMFQYLSIENISRCVYIIKLPLVGYIESYSNINDHDLLSEILDSMLVFLKNDDQLKLSDEELDHLELYMERNYETVTKDTDIKLIGCWRVLTDFISRYRATIKPRWIIDRPDNFKIDYEPILKNPLLDINGTADKYDAMAENDSEMFRRYGPLNRKFASNIEVTDQEREENICAKIGCRMFSCLEYNDPDFDELYKITIDDPHICDKCHKKIDNNRWALREPLPGGGWANWFCSLKCLNFIAVDKIKVEIMEKLLSRYGIYNSIKEGEK